MARVDSNRHKPARTRTIGGSSGPPPATPITAFIKPVDSQSSSHFMRLPTEVRLIILSHLIDPPKVLYNWLERHELAKQYEQDESAVLKKLLSTQTFRCCQILLQESRTLLYGSTILRIQCEWTEGWSRIAIGGGRLAHNVLPRILPEARLLGKAEISQDRQLRGVPCMAAVLLFRKIEIAMIDNFLDQAFPEICYNLKDIVAAKDVVLTIRRSFPTSAMGYFNIWHCKSIVVNNSRVYSELKRVRDVITRRLVSANSAHAETDTAKSSHSVSTRITWIQ